MVSWHRYAQRFDPGYGEDPNEQGGQYLRPSYSNHVRANFPPPLNMVLHNVDV